jgi:DNA modification methylase
MVNKIINSDCIEGLKTLPDESVDCCVTSPPYFGLRDYGHDGQIGLEETPDAFVSKMVEVFTEVKRVLKKEGTLWLNLGDSYAGSGKGANPDGSVHVSALSAKQGTHKGTTEGIKKPQKAHEIGLKPKDLIGIPWMVAFALRSSGWYLRQDIIWHKPNPMPESVTDRCTKAHEYIFLLSKSAKYYYDHEAIKEESVTYENRPAGVVRNRLYDYDSKENNNPEAYLKRVKLGAKSFSKGQAAGLGIEPSGNGKNDYYDVPTDRNKRSVWTVTTKPFSAAHFATFPEDLIVDMIKAGCPENGLVLDPFMGAGTTALVASKLNRDFIGFELNPAYIAIAKKRLQDELGMFNKMTGCIELPTPQVSDTTEDDSSKEAGK